jgi:energy-coupling factor transport system ATP-binding protein
MSVTRSPLIHVQELAHSYLAGTDLRVDSLQGVDFSVFPGETVGVIGPAGSGKSTLLHHLNGLILPMSGRVLVDGVSILDYRGELTKVRARVGLLFQNPENQLFEQFAGDDVAFGPRNMGMGPGEVRERVREALEMVGLPFSFKDRLVAHLSVGEKRRIALAGVLAMGPELLVLDEPTSSLDPEGRRRLLKTLRGWKSVRGRAIVIASHNMNEIMEMSDRVYVFDRGQVVLSGTARQVFGRADLLRSIGLEPPAAALFMNELSKRGFTVPTDVLTDGEAAREVERLRDG